MSKIDLSADHELREVRDAVLEIEKTGQERLRIALEKLRKERSHNFQDILAAVSDLIDTVPDVELKLANPVWDSFVEPMEGGDVMGPDEDGEFLGRTPGLN